MLRATRVTVLSIAVSCLFFASCKSRDFGEENDSSTNVALWDMTASNQIKNFEKAYDLVKNSVDRDRLRRLLLVDATYFDRFRNGRFQSEKTAPLSVSPNLKNNGEAISLFMIMAYSFSFEFKSFSDINGLKPISLRQPKSPENRDDYIIYAFAKNFKGNGPQRSRAQQIEAEENIKKDVTAEFAKLKQSDVRRLRFSYLNLLSGMNLTWDDHKGTPSYQILDHAEKNNPIK